MMGWYLINPELLLVSSCGRKSRGSALGPGAASSRGCSWCTFRVLKSRVPCQKQQPQRGSLLLLSMPSPCTRMGFAFFSFYRSAEQHRPHMAGLWDAFQSLFAKKTEHCTNRGKGKYKHWAKDSCLSCASLFLAQVLLMWKLTSSKESFSCKHLFLQKQCRWQLNFPSEAFLI